jgi:SAM-dependent methyltransferase
VIAEVGDVAKLPYRDGSVDLVVSTLSQHHWPDRPAALAELARVLAPGGRIWIYDLRGALRTAQGRGRGRVPGGGRAGRPGALRHLRPGARPPHHPARRRDRLTVPPAGVDDCAGPDRLLGVPWPHEQPARNGRLGPRRLHRDPVDLAGARGVPERGRRRGALVARPGRGRRPRTWSGSPPAPGGPDPR